MRAISWKTDQHDKALTLQIIINSNENNSNNSNNDSENNENNKKNNNNDNNGNNMMTMTTMTRTMATATITVMGMTHILLTMMTRTSLLQSNDWQCLR